MRVCMCAQRHGHAAPAAHCYPCGRAPNNTRERSTACVCVCSLLQTKSISIYISHSRTPNRSTLARTETTHTQRETAAAREVLCSGDRATSTRSRLMMELPPRYFSPHQRVCSARARSLALSLSPAVAAAATVRDCTGTYMYRYYHSLHPSLAAAVAARRVFEQ